MVLAQSSILQCTKASLAWSASQVRNRDVVGDDSSFRDLWLHDFWYAHAYPTDTAALRRTQHVQPACLRVKL